MTDTYVENVIIEKFKELPGLTVNETENEDGTITKEYPEIAFPNIDFTTPDDHYWYELQPIPGIDMQIELGTEARSRWTGIFQINIVTPINIGTQSANDSFDAIASLFKKGSIINGVRIDKVDREHSVTNSDLYMLPVSIYWTSDLDR